MLRSLFSKAPLPAWGEGSLRAEPGGRRPQLVSVVWGGGGGLEETDVGSHRAFIPFRKLITLPHFPASKGCSFSRPMKVML